MIFNAQVLFFCAVFHYIFGYSFKRITLNVGERGHAQAALLDLVGDCLDSCYVGGNLEFLCRAMAIGTGVRIDLAARHTGSRCVTVRATTPSN